MTTCYLCGQQLTDKNKSLEHIIPNALGGRLKSKDILCKTCNSKMGEVIDTELVKVFMPLNMAIKPKRDRDSTQKIKTIIFGQTAFLYSNDRIATQFQPKITQNGDKKQVEIMGIFTNEKDCNDFIKQSNNCIKGNFADKQPKMQIIKHIIEKPAIYHNFKIPFDNNLLTLGYLKILLGFCAYKDKIQDIDSNIILSFKKRDAKTIKMTICCEPKLFGVDKESYHRIYLLGVQNTGNLFGIVSIYDYTTSFCLNDNYKGESFLEGYCYDVAKDIEIDAILEFNAFV